MKILQWALLAGVFAAATVTSQAQTQDRRVVFVNLDRVFTEFYKTQLADAHLKEQAEEYNRERRVLVEEYETLTESFNAAREAAQDTALSETVRSQKRSESEELMVQIRGLETRVERFDQTRRQQLEDQGRRMRERLVEEIQEQIRRYALDEGFHAVIDSSGQSINAIAMVLYLDRRVDITDTVIELLNVER